MYLIFGYGPPDTIGTFMLYFAYSAFLDPVLLSQLAPKAEFQFIAHLPETRLTFPDTEGRPSLEPAPGNTVWGAVFKVSGTELKAIGNAEGSEGRVPIKDCRAVDRSGHKYDVSVFAQPFDGSDHRPSAPYMEQVVKGARHWQLPTGWVAGLEDLAEDDL